MLHVVYKPAKRRKWYRAITKWSDGYRLVYPDGKNPMFGMDRLASDKPEVVIVAEGSKAARRVQDIADGKEPKHAWADALAGSVAVGWIGGALAPHKTDFSQIEAFKTVKRVYIFADNDDVGRKAIARISQQFERVEVFAVEFDELSWPIGFDLGDDFPKEKFKQGRYIGPSLSDLVRPATFATKQRTDEKGKPYCVPSEAFVNQWVYSDAEMLYVNKYLPKVTYTAERLNKAIKPFQHDRKVQVSSYIDYNDVSHVDKFEYRPDMYRGTDTVRRFKDDSLWRFNTFQATSMRPVKGDTAIFHDFLKFSIADDAERKEFLRWFFTLIGRPATRMSYGVLLVSKQTGTGKSTVGEKILFPLLGHDNCAVPGSDELDSQFSAWVKGKRLAFVNELYIGGSNRKTTGRLKTIITDRHVRVNEKHEKVEGILNFIHLLACSNDNDAVKLDAQDRRWFIPRWTEERWTRLAELREWVDNGNLPALLFEAQTQEKNFYVQPHEIAPKTEKKRQVVDSSLSKIMKRVVTLCGDVADEEKADDRKVCFTADTLNLFIEKNEKGPSEVWDQNPARIELMKSDGWLYTGQHEKGSGTLGGYQPRLGPESRKSNVLISPALAVAVIDESDKDKRLALIKSHLKSYADLENRYGKAM